MYLFYLNLCPIFFGLLIFRAVLCGPYETYVKLNILGDSHDKSALGSSEFTKIEAKMSILQANLKLSNFTLISTSFFNLI